MTRTTAPVTDVMAASNGNTVDRPGAALRQSSMVGANPSGLST
jgi:hypothetical protein